MDPEQQNHNFELPTPQSGAPAGNGQDTGSGIPLRMPAGPPASHQGPSQPAPAQPQAAQPLASPMTADDADLIEKEWVTKAKQIVSATKDDPHKQNKEISRFKAEYLKKRYHKDIKVEDA